MTEDGRQSLNTALLGVKLKIDKFWYIHQAWSSGPSKRGGVARNRFPIKSQLFAERFNFAAYVDAIYLDT